MSRLQAFACGVPDKECGGAHMKMQAKLSPLRLHGTREQAFKCYTNWLKRRGYVMVDDNPREWINRDIDGDGIIMLPKKSRFGAEFRAGKEDRVMAERGSGTLG